MQNSYVSIALSRLVELIVCCEIVISVAELLLFGSHSVLKSSSCGDFSSAIFVTLGLFVLFLVDFEKVPFDVVEAESELIDG